MSQNNSEYIIICLVGCIGAGKSTILNAFFGQPYAQYKTIRTTMIPNVFIETDNPTQIESFETIYQKISNTNEQIHKQITNNPNGFKLSDYGNELSFYINRLDINSRKQTKICIYDIPGLNTTITKNTHYEYLENNFHKFDVILFVANINSKLNKPHEIEILNFLADNIKKHKIQSNKNINMMTIVNKVNNVNLLEDSFELPTELYKIFKLKLDTVQQVFKKKNIESHLIGCKPVCGLDAYLYKMIKKDYILMLSDSSILRIGVNNEGYEFRRYTKEIRRDKVHKLIQNKEFIDNMLNSSGFTQIEKCLKNFIKSKYQSTIPKNISEQEYLCSFTFNY